MYRYVFVIGAYTTDVILMIHYTMQFCQALNIKIFWPRREARWVGKDNYEGKSGGKKAEGSRGTEGRRTPRMSSARRQRLGDSGGTEDDLANTFVQ